MTQKVNPTTFDQFRNDLEKEGYYPGRRIVHYKGGEYTFDKLGINAETNQPCVHYLGDDGMTFTRDMTNFFELVLTGEEKMVPRFELKENTNADIHFSNGSVIYNRPLTFGTDRIR